MPDYRNRPPVDEPRPTWRDVIREISPRDLILFALLAIAGCCWLYAFAIYVGCA